MTRLIGFITRPAAVCIATLALAACGTQPKPAELLTFEQLQGNAVESAYSPDGSILYVSNFRRHVVEVIDFAEFGMEAVWRIRVAGVPAFLVIDDKGNDFYRRVRRRSAA